MDTAAGKGPQAPQARLCDSSPCFPDTGRCVNIPPGGHRPLSYRTSAPTVGFKMQASSWKLFKTKELAARQGFYLLIPVRPGL